MSDIGKYKQRRGYYRRMRYFRIEMKRFLNAHRKEIPTICLVWGSPVIWLKGRTGGYPLERVTPVIV